MCFSMENVINFNLTHVTIEKNINKRKFAVKFISLFFYILFFLVLSHLWFGGKYFSFIAVDGIVKKIFFSVSLLLMINIIIKKIEDILYKKNKSPWFVIFYALLFLSLPIPWCLNFNSWYFFWIAFFIVPPFFFKMKE